MIRIYFQVLKVKVVHVSFLSAASQVLCDRGTPQKEESYQVYLFIFLLKASYYCFLLIFEAAFLPVFS